MVRVRILLVVWRLDAFRPRESPSLADAGETEIANLSPDCLTAISDRTAILKYEGGWSVYARGQLWAGSGRVPRTSSAILRAITPPAPHY